MHQLMQKLGNPHFEKTKKLPVLPENQRNGVKSSRVQYGHLYYILNYTSFTVIGIFKNRSST
jgi:hypothetical protein